MVFKVTVWGFGYVGQELAKACMRKAYSTQVFDPNMAKFSEFKKDNSNSAIKKLSMHSNICEMGESEYHVICVPTPLDSERNVDLSYIRSAVQNLVQLVNNKPTIILESTSYPGTLQEVVLDELQKNGLVLGVDFLLGFSPERVDPGNTFFGFRNTPKIVSGMTPDCVVSVENFYKDICESVVVASTPMAAETAKLLENTYRLVNISFINEFSMLISDLGLDPKEIIELAGTKPYGFHKFYPSLGIGGHCIPIDPVYLQHSFKSKLNQVSKFIELGLSMNEDVLTYNTDKIYKILKDQKCKSLLVLGLSYKANVADYRESPTLLFLKKLEELDNLEKDIKVVISDPNPSAINFLVNSSGDFITHEELVSGTLIRFDVVFVAQKHDQYTKNFLERLGNKIIYPF